MAGTNNVPADASANRSCCSPSLHASHDVPADAGTYGSCCSLSTDSNAELYGFSRFCSIYGIVPAFHDTCRPAASPHCIPAVTESWKRSGFAAT